MKISFNNIRTKALQKASVLYKSSNDITWAEAMKLGWQYTKRAYLLELMNDTIISVKFKKKSGEVTTRKATRQKTLYKVGTSKKSPAHTIPFFDLDKDRISSAIISNIISIKVA